MAFKEKWLMEPEFKLWLRKGKEEKGYCIFCDGTINIKHASDWALKKHAMTDKHKLKMAAAFPVKHAEGGFTEHSLQSTNVQSSSPLSGNASLALTKQPETNKIRPQIGHSIEAAQTSLAGNFSSTSQLNSARTYQRNKIDIPHRLVSTAGYEKDKAITSDKRSHAVASTSRYRSDVKSNRHISIDEANSKHKQAEVISQDECSYAEEATSTYQQDKEVTSNRCTVVKATSNRERNEVMTPNQCNHEAVAIPESQQTELTALGRCSPAPEVSIHQAGREATPFRSTSTIKDTLKNQQDQNITQDIRTSDIDTTFRHQEGEEEVGLSGHINWEAAIENWIRSKANTTRKQNSDENILPGWCNPVPYSLINQAGWEVTSDRSSSIVEGTSKNQDEDLIQDRLSSGVDVTLKHQPEENGLSNLCISTEIAKPSHPNLEVLTRSSSICEASTTPKQKSDEDIAGDWHNSPLRYQTEDSEFVNTVEESTEALMESPEKSRTSLLCAKADETGDSVSLYMEEAQKHEVLAEDIEKTLFCVRENIPFDSYNVTKFQNIFRNGELRKKVSSNSLNLEYISIGLASHFSRKMLDNVNVCTLYFKEALNKSLQYKVIDIYIRYWNEADDKIDMRYLTSSFFSLGTPSSIILQRIEESLKHLKERKIKIVQRCFDGPKMSPINSFEEEDRNTGDITFNLRSFICAVRETMECDEGHSDWYLGYLNCLLNALHNLFEESSNRTERFLKFSNIKKLPSRFWYTLCEKKFAAKTAIDIWGDIQEFAVEDVQTSSSAFYPVVKVACDDCLTPVKLHFFVYVSELVEGFVTAFMKHSVFLPYFAENVEEFVVNSLKQLNIVKRNCDFENHVTLLDFIAANISPNTLNIDIDLGFKADIVLRSLINDNKITNKQVVFLKVEAREFVLKMFKKLLEESLITHPIVGFVSCLTPSLMVSNESDSIKKLDDLLGFFIHTNAISIEDCDDIRLQFKTFLGEISLPVILECTDTNSPNDVELHIFFRKFLSKPHYRKLWDFVKIVLILFNGNIDNDINILNEKELGEMGITQLNRYEECYCARRTILDFIRNEFKDGIAISNAMRQYVSEAIFDLRKGKGNEMFVRQAKKRKFGELDSE